MGSDSEPVALYPVYITSQPTTLIVKQHFDTTESGDFTCFRSDSSVLFEVVGQGKSTKPLPWTFEPCNRRYLNLKEQWYLEFPGDEQTSRQPNFSVAMKWKGWANFDITMDNIAASKAESITLEIRARSLRHTTWDVILEGRNIIEARKIPGVEAPRETARIRNNPAWELDVVAGIDLSIVRFSIRVG
ncbi:hypothetical protein D0861_05981 [Hortaea werneckii]|uniref:Uncharacterized protein n=1 Tax=Hortaea werneckii TaxID=91943 RepID=A0A3M7FBW6_HORWE|nr:hypothetical protein D0861_05981 [Hortaea werneckii]